MRKVSGEHSVIVVSIRLSFCLSIFYTLSEVVVDNKRSLRQGFVDSQGNSRNSRSLRSYKIIMFHKKLMIIEQTPFLRQMSFKVIFEGLRPFSSFILFWYTNQKYKIQIEKYTIKIKKKNQILQRLTCHSQPDFNNMTQSSIQLC
jgi:hypothetical protein